MFEAVKEKRSKAKIYFDILKILDEETKSGKISLTKIARYANLPYNRFQKCLCQLAQLEMIGLANDGKIFVTEKGLKFINKYVEFHNFLKEIGVST